MEIPLRGGKGIRFFEVFTDNFLDPKPIDMLSKLDEDALFETYGKIFPDTLFYDLYLNIPNPDGHLQRDLVKLPTENKDKETRLN